MKSKLRFVILGGGFAGTTLASKLEKSLPAHWDIFLLNDTNAITYHPLLPEVVGATVSPNHIETPIRHLLKRTRVRMVTVDHIDFNERIVFYHNNEQGQLSFDQLVIASGVGANLSMISGLEAHALPLKTVGDAIDIRNKMIERLEQATIHPDPEQRKKLTTFVVIGGGFSGVEVAGQMEDFLSHAQKYYKNVKKKDCRVVLIHAMDRLLPELSPELASITEKKFRKRGIQVHLNSEVKEVCENHVELNDGTRIEGALIVCTIGTQANAAKLSSELPLHRGKIVTLGDLSVVPFEGVWALGDCALVPNAYDSEFCPPTAQCADRQARFLAKVIIATLKGKSRREFSYKTSGMLAAIGHRYAVADIHGLQLSGFFAFLMWRSVYLLKVPSFTRKFRILLEWSWGLFFPTDVAHLGFKRTKQKNTRSIKNEAFVAIETD